MIARHLAAYLALALAALSPVAHAVATIGGCPLFPADNYWNTRVDNLPLHPSSAAWVNSVGASTGLHPDFSNNLADGYGFTPLAVTSAQPRVPITFYDATGAAESDAGPYPIPPVLATPGGYREVVVLETTSCVLYELYGAPLASGTSWIASSAAKFDVRSNALRPDGHLSMNLAGLPVLQGLVRWEEVATGEITHAIGMTSNSVWGRVALPGGGTAMKYLWPARHGSGDSTNESFPPMGARFRLKASFDISRFDPRTQVVLRALKKYGLVLSSRGGNWFVWGVSNPNFPDSFDGEMKSIAGSNFEVVDTSLLQINPDSAQAVQLDAGPEAPTNFAAVPGSGQATFTFTAPASSSTTPILSYVVTCNPGALTASGAGSPITLTGLATGVAYTCRVAAVYASGPGTPSAPIQVTLGRPDEGFPPGGLPSGWIQVTGSSAPWVVANDAAYAGSLSLKSGLIRDGQRSELAFTARFATGNVSFARKVSSQQGFDFLQFLIDGVVQASWSGDLDWATFSFPLGAGTHTLAWRYVKDGSASSGADAAWIDSVVLPARAQCRFPMANGRCLTE